MSISNKHKNKKGWRAFKGVVKSLFKDNVKLKSEQAEEIQFDGFSWRPPVILRLEESVFNPDYSITLGCSNNSSSESLTASLSSSSSITIAHPFYLSKVPSNVKIPLKSSMKSLRASPSEPCLNGMIDKSDSSLNDTLNYLNITFHFEDNDEDNETKVVIRSHTATPFNKCKRLPFSSQAQVKTNLSKAKALRFDENVVVYETYNIEDYPRTAVEPPEFTKKELERVNKEIRKYKLGEMRVHPESFNNLLLSV
ncbi:hypothetical protein K502DRAFT_322667 [Neoconidiobolus thromboides FSU 785]|nr:hypothetical protein K502DRAFT_322667 [Neoconidiobolus thromboides FSU 785]